MSECEFQLSHFSIAQEKKKKEGKEANNPSLLPLLRLSAVHRSTQMTSITAIYGVLKNVLATANLSSSEVEVCLPSHDLYKAMREEELRAARALVRVFAMQQGNSDFALSSKQQQRILEDLCDSLQIPIDTIETEKALASKDPVVGLIAAANASKLRTAHLDAYNDVSLEAWSTMDINETEDDGATLLKRAGVAAGTSAAPVGQYGSTAAARRATEPLKKRAPGEQHLNEIRQLGKECESLAVAVTKTADDSKRSVLRQQLLDKKVQLLSLRQKIELEMEERRSGRTTPSGPL